MKQANAIEKLNYVSKFSHEFDISKAKQFKDEFQDKKLSVAKRFGTLLKMLSDKSYKLKSSTKVAITGALAYTIMPIDLLPDYIIGLGFADDAVMLKIVLDSALDEIKRYTNLKEVKNG